MDPHFSVLGLKRGSSENDMKKAYHRKALEYHPDRNPGGAEIFKRVQVAYEALQKHYKIHGGVDMVLSNSSSGISEPLMSESELFGGNAAPRRYPFRPFRQRDAPPPPPPPSDGSSAFTEADVLRAKAHGSRVPVSGYDPFHGESAEMDAFMTQAKHFADMERRKAALGGQQSSPSGSSRASAEPQTHQHPRKPAASSSTAKAAADGSPVAATSRPANKPCHAQLDDEWRKMKQQAEEEAQTQQYILETERQRRKHELEKETRDEWNRLQAAMEAEHLNQRARETAAETAIRLEEHKKTNEHIMSLQREKRELKAQLYSGRMPSAGEIDRMSEMELFVMQDVLQQALDRVAVAFRRRMAPITSCCVCGNSKAAKGEHPVQFFTCDHRCTCASCGRNLFTCPVCGAESLDLMRNES